MKVFLSHSIKDRAFVELLVAKLKSEGFEYWWCEEDIPPADSFVQRINAALEETDLALLVWSPDAKNSAWVQAEWETVYALEVQRSGLPRLGVIMLWDCDLPPLLRTRQYFDSRKDREAGLKQAVEWVKQRSHVRTIKLPAHVPAEFVGRTLYFERLEVALVKQPGEVLLYGEPGSGKSALALKFASNDHGCFQKVVYQSCGSFTLKEIVAAVAKQLDLDFKTRSLRGQIEAVKRRMQDQRSLMVLVRVRRDDVERLMPGPPVSVLLASQYQAVAPHISPGNRLKVDSLSETEAEWVFRKCLDEKSGGGHLFKECRPALLKLASRVEYLPLAVAAAAEHIQSSNAPPLELIERIGLASLRSKAHNVPDVLESAIAVRPEGERRLLQAVAVCAAEGFWLPLASVMAGLDKQESDKARDNLVNASLLKPVDLSRQRFRLHVLLRQQLRSQSSLSVWQEKHAAALDRLFQNGTERWCDCRECLGEILGAVDWLGGKGQQHRLINLAQLTFQVATELGELEAPLHKLEQETAGTEWRARRAKDILRRVYRNQAMIWSAWGRLGKAFRLHKMEEALARQLGEREGLQASYRRQAIVLYTWARSEIQAVLEENLGESGKSPEALRTAQRKLEKALELHTREAELCRAPEKKDALQASYDMQAAILIDLGRVQEAVALLKERQDLCQSLGRPFELRANYGVHAVFLKVWRGLEDAMEELKKEADTLEKLGAHGKLLGNYEKQKMILETFRRPVEAKSVEKKKEDLLAKAGDRDILKEIYPKLATVPEYGRQLEGLSDLLAGPRSELPRLGPDRTLLPVLGDDAAILGALGRPRELASLLNELEEEEKSLIHGGKKVQTENDDRKRQRKEALQANYGDQAAILWAMNRLPNAVGLLRRQQELCAELGDRDGLLVCYGRQAAILKESVRAGSVEERKNEGLLEEAETLERKQGALSFELGLRTSLGYCFWNWGLLCWVQESFEIATEKLNEALRVFEALNMQPETQELKEDLKEPFSQTVSVAHI